MYSNDAILRTVYDFSDRCDVALTTCDKNVLAHLTRKNPQADLENLSGSFFTALADHELRMHISRETNDIRTLIIAQAFAEADLLDEGNHTDD
jgi:His-Xaa-Ser system protein HxsD